MDSTCIPEEHKVWQEMKTHGKTSLPIGASERKRLKQLETALDKRAIAIGQDVRIFRYPAMTVYALDMTKPTR